MRKWIWLFLILVYLNNGEKLELPQDTSMWVYTVTTNNIVTDYQVNFKYWENGPKTLLYHLKEITAVVDTEKNKIIYPANCKLKRRK